MINKIFSKQLIDSFMNLSSDGIVITDLNGCVIEVNRKFEEMHGWSRAEVIGQFLPMVPDDYKDRSLELCRRVLEGEQICGIEMVKLRQDGSTFDANVTISPIKSEEGEIVAFIGLERDITEKKKAERELSEREMQFRKLIKLNPEPIILHDMGEIRFVNDSCCRLFGRADPGDMAGRSIYEMVSERDRDLFREQIAEVIRSDDYTAFTEMQLRRFDGTVVEVEVSSVYIHKNMGQPLIQTVIRDITVRKKSEEIMRNSEKLSVIGQLAAGIAHDIRNPLTSLRGFLQLQKERKADYSEIMMEEIDHINYVVSEFMALAKPHVNHYTRVDMKPLVQSVVNFLQPQAILYNVQMDIEIVPENLSLFCVSDQIKQVLINIVKNAIEAMPSGGTISLMARQRAAQRIEIDIRDTGSGIPEDELSRIGEPFHTSKSGGNGLGWMISQRIIAEHGGSISISSKVNQGTTVKIELPVRGQHAN